MEWKKNCTEEAIYQYILQQIISKRLFPGNRIIEDQLAKDMGVSRTPVRTVLKRLNYEGLVTIISHKGSYLVNPSYDEIREAYECKMLIESEAARLACVNITATEIEQLNKLIEEEIQSHAARDLQKFILINNEFHRIIAHASGNRYYEKYVIELNNKCSVYLLYYDNFTMTATEDSHALHGHRTIIEALRSGNAQECAEAASRHNRITLNELKMI